MCLYEPEAAHDSQKNRYGRGSPRDQGHHSFPLEQGTKADLAGTVPALESCRAGPNGELPLPPQAIWRGEPSTMLSMLRTSLPNLLQCIFIDNLAQAKSTLLT